MLASMGLWQPHPSGTQAPHSRKDPGKRPAHGRPPVSLLPSSPSLARSHPALPLSLKFKASLCIMRNNRGQETKRGYYQLINQSGDSEGCGKVSEMRPPGLSHPSPTIDSQPHDPPASESQVLYLIVSSRVRFARGCGQRQTLGWRRD